MAVTGNLDAMRDFGGRLSGIAGGEPTVPPLLGMDGPLSGGVGGAHDSVAQAAANFAREMNTGVDAAGGRIVQVADQLETVDDRSAKSMTRSI